MDLFHKLIDLLDKNSKRIPEGDYVEICNVMRDIRRKVQPPSFLLDQNEPMTLPSDPVTTHRKELHQQWREGGQICLRELHEEWS